MPSIVDQLTEAIIKARRDLAPLIKDWDEDEHPRGAGGKFGSGSGDSASPPTVTGPDGVVSIDMGISKELEDGAKAYSESMGIARPEVDYSKVMVDTSNAKEIAGAYDKLPSDDPAAHEAYKALAEEVSKQYEHMTGAMGITVSVVKEDPYKDITEMRRDVLENHHIAVLSTAETGSHPFLTDAQNDQFRAVHDVFGHAATGRGFDRHGEEAAWVSHSLMFSPQARQAMTTETRGQNSVLTQVGQGFPEQKVAVLPAKFTDASSIVQALKKMLARILKGSRKASSERNCTAGPAQWDYKNKLGRWSSKG